MRLYELLNPSGTMPMPPSSAATAPMVNPSVAAPPPAPTAAVQPPIGQQANMLTDFFSTPHPIGGASAPRSGANAAGQPGFVDKAVGNQAPNFLGQINRSLSGSSPTPTTPLKPAG